MWMCVRCVCLCVFDLDWITIAAWQYVFFLLFRVWCWYEWYTQICVYTRNTLWKQKCEFSRREKKAAAIRVRLITYYSRLDNLKVVQLFFCSLSVSALLFFLWFDFFLLCCRHMQSPCVSVRACTCLRSFDSKLKRWYRSDRIGREERKNERREKNNSEIRNA